MLIKELSRMSAICELDPTAGFELTKDNQIKNWISSVRNQPTEEEIDEKYNELKAEYDAQAYARTRQQNYPNTDDLIVALWEKVMEGRSESADALEVNRQEVKTANPKPE